jgi:hypothetical protein
VSQAKPGEVSFAVVDSGIGISPEVQKRLFQPFEQADNSNWRGFGGTGLGLSISRQLVNLMGGEIGLRPTLGEGSTLWFRVKLPETEVVAQPVTQSPVDLPQKRILLAEDNLVNQKVITRMLQKLGQQVAVAADGQAAFDMYQRESFDLILMDMQMPDIDDLEATVMI